MDSRKLGRVWKLDQDGNILNDAAVEKVDPIFDSLVQSVRETYLKHEKDRIHSIYLTGSISRGLAVPNKSDLDAFAVFKKGHLIENLDWLEPSERELLATFPLVSDVQMEVWPWEYVFPESAGFSVGSFIIKTHSVCLYGENLDDKIAPFKVSAAIANDDIVQIKPDIEEALREVNTDSSSSHVSYWCKRIMKNIIRTGFALIMNKERAHTRDLPLCVSLFSKYYPEQAESMRMALEKVVNPTSSRQDMRSILDSFGKWMVLESEKWLDQYNPKREISLKLE